MLRNNSKQSDSTARFFNLGDASPKWGHEMIFGGCELDSTIIIFSHKFVFFVCF